MYTIVDFLPIAVTSLLAVCKLCMSCQLFLILNKSVGLGRFHFTSVNYVWRLKILATSFSLVDV